MINDQIVDLMTEVRELIENAEGSNNRVMLHVVHGLLASAHTLMYQVNANQLARLMNGDS